MTALSHSEKEAMMKDMKSFDETMPSVGIFWYDPEEHDFFGVYKKELTPKMIEDAADKGLPYINYQRLHRQIWKEHFFRAPNAISRRLRTCMFSYRFSEFRSA